MILIKRAIIKNLLSSFGISILYLVTIASLVFACCQMMTFALSLDPVFPWSKPLWHSGIIAFSIFAFWLTVVVYYFKSQAHRNWQKQFNDAINSTVQKQYSGVTDESVRSTTR
jgi:uncharacterized membrane protein